MIIINKAADADVNESVNEFSLIFSFFFFLTFFTFSFISLQHTLNTAHHFNAKIEKRLLLLSHF